MKQINYFLHNSYNVCFRGGGGFHMVFRKTYFSETFKYA